MNKIPIDLWGCNENQHATDFNGDKNDYQVSNLKGLAQRVECSSSKSKTLL